VRARSRCGYSSADQVDSGAWRAFHLGVCIPVRPNGVSVSRSNQEQALIRSSALDFER
jgi:hypothetical protein